jgi:tRNA threonylcarbamoyladenosine biosynthesis protein TsaE
MQNPRSRMHVFRSHSEADTAAFGVALGRRISEGTCVSIVGPLGAGKTVLIRGICRGLAVEEEILSPTFILCEEFKGRLPVTHVDLYRLEHEKEIEELGVFEKLGSNNVILVEWADRSSYLNEASDIVIELGFVNESTREIKVLCSRRWKGVFDELRVGGG